MEKTNFDALMQKEIENIVKIDRVPKLMLHACCAPCSSSVLKRLSDIFDITVLFYNPNITESDEYHRRYAEIKRFIEEVPHKNKIDIFESEYDPNTYLDAVKGHESDLEGGERCFICFELRLRKTAKIASKLKYDYFTTTLSISPLKNSSKLNEIGNNLSEEFGIKYLFSDFKKRDGYKESIELSKQYNLYRQDYCGCIFSRNKEV